MGDKLQTTLQELTKIQRKAVEWEDGPLLVLAGPGSGKTRVLTCRVAQLLENSKGKRFRVLALTITHKAAHEMSGRVAALVPELDERADIHTFHSFCAQLLRQHGAHLGIKPNFAIFSRKCDRQAILEDAIRCHSQLSNRSDCRFLPMIDNLKARMIGPDQVERIDHGTRNESPELSKGLAQAYRLYERELRRANALDFNSLVFEAYKLFEYPIFVRHCQTMYKHWVIDEIQETNGAQLSLLVRMAGGNFRRIFAVADDDQTIHEWNGANVHRIRDLVKRFKCEVVQLPTNFRCPFQIVEAANRLLVYNVRRDQSKLPAQPAKGARSIDNQQILQRVFQTDDNETAGIAESIAKLDVAERAQTLVLARTRALLESMQEALDAKQIAATILMRRDDFASPQMRWLVACLKLINRPLDRRNLSVLVEAFSAFASVRIDIADLLSQSQAQGYTCLSVWLDTVRRCTLPAPSDKTVELVANLVAGQLGFSSTMDRVLQNLENHNSSQELTDDLSAWRRLTNEIRAAVGNVALDRFLQELEMRSKEPAPEPGAVSLATIHGAKGLEFDNVYLIGLAEDILPSRHSIKKGQGSAALEEERRSCFVAITRTRKRLVLSRASQYKGWPKQPSRFLAEMGFTD